MHDPSTLVWSYKNLIEIWHEDPCTDGTDDSCGWFKRGRHGDKEILKKIESRFNFDWDREFKSVETDKKWNRGLFKHGTSVPNQSTLSIGINLFWMAAFEHYSHNWKKTEQFMNSNLFSILSFIENPFDSLKDSIENVWEEEISKEERIHNIAYCIYGWILRKDTPWYKHAKFHIQHWKIRIIPLIKLKNWIFQRCSICKKRFKWNESKIGNWGGTACWHEKCDNINKIKTY